MHKYPRLLKLLKTQSLFLFGARNTGKSTLVQDIYANSGITLDLLNKKTKARLARNPDELYKIVMGCCHGKLHYKIIFVTDFGLVPAKGRPF